MDKEFSENVSTRFDLTALSSVIYMVLIWQVISAYDIESQLGLVSIFPLFIGAFVINHFLPVSKRMHWQIIATFLGSVYLLGLLNGLILLALAFALLVSAHAPIKFGFKVLIVGMLGALLAALKTGVLPGIVPESVITILASMFMFRMIIYLYDIRHEKVAIPWPQRLTYFFLLPNLVFPIFPIIDYKVFKSTYQNDGYSKMYHRGIEMIARGVLHLLLYRLIYMYFIPAADEITNVMLLSQYLFYSYLTILRLSGMFHIAVGMVVMFGFNLPEIFNNYFLASGFSDYWRRINIYWKDFVLKIFYYPIYFKVKHWGLVTAMTLTTLIVFFFNWLLHAYQWFWILGEFFVRSTDIAFWSIFGILVTISAVIQAKSGRKKMQFNSWRYAIGQSLKIILTFITASLMWSIWISPDFNSWTALMYVGFESGVKDWFKVVGLVIIAGLLLLMGHWLYYNHLKGGRIERGILEANKLVLLIILSLLYLGSTKFGKGFLENRGIPMESYSRMKLNKTDQTTQFEGYYEEILTAVNFSSPLWQQSTKTVEHLNKTDMVLPTQDLLINRLAPNLQREFKGHLVTTNEWGMRDRSYSLTADSGTVRIALLGGSIEMGSGVADEEVFEQLLEDRYNSSGSFDVEILNFSISARNLIQHLYNLEQNVLRFEPDVVLLFNHDREWNAITNLFLKVIKGHKVIKEFPYEELNEMIRQMDIEEGVSKEEMLRKVIPELRSIYAFCYKRMSDICRENEILPIWVHLPSLEPEGSVRITFEEARELALESDLKCIDLNDVFDMTDKETLKVSSDDNHPNAIGHALIADALYAKLEPFLKNIADVRD